MRPEERAVIAAMIEKGLKYLARSYADERAHYLQKDLFLCNAVDLARCHDGFSFEHSRLTRDYISAQIEGHSTFCGWLRTKHPELDAAIKRDQDGQCKRLQKTRRAWAKHMIATLRAIPGVKGD